jgi:hypothetical protein
VAFDYQAKLNALHGIMSEANTTTASFDLSSGMADRIKNIKKDDPAVRPAQDDEHPFIWVWIDRAEQNFDEIGVTNTQGITKRMSVSYKILATIHKRGLTAAHENALTDIYKLADNITTLFQTKYTLSDTAMWILPKTTEFLGPVGLGGNYIKGVLMNLEAEYLFR